MGIVSILSILAIGLSTNLDGIRIGLFYGMRKIAVPWRFYAVISIVSVLGSLIGGLTGQRITHLASSPLFGPIGSAILVTMGLWTMIQTLTHDGERDDVTPARIGFNETMLIGASEAMADLSLGFGTGFIGLNVITVAISLGVFRLVCLFLANHLGHRLSAVRFSRSAEIFSGILLIIVGLLR